MKLTDKQKQILQALVDGKEVEYFSQRRGSWYDINDLQLVSVCPNEDLRIKPEVPKDIVVTEFKKYLPSLDDAYNPHNVEYTYDGVTHELKSVRLIEQKLNPQNKPQTDSEGWISNVGNDTQCWPEGYGITKNTRIETLHRSGEIDTRNAGEWDLSWTETDKHPSDIIRFRILKDQDE